MKIGILQADTVMPQFQSAHGNYPAMIETILNRAALELGVEVSFITYDVEHGHYPESVNECDGYVITGSKKSVYDDEPWIGQLKDYVRLLYELEVKLVGICFGHQLIAEALGGRTVGSEKGWGVGIHTSEVLNHAWFMQPGMKKFSLIVSHKDQVVDLPENAQLLATSSFCPNSMYCLGDQTLALQGHPEFTRRYSEDLINWREDILGPEKYAEGIASLDQSLNSQEISIWIINFLKGK